VLRHTSFYTHIKPGGKARECAKTMGRKGKEREGKEKKGKEERKEQTQRSTF